MDTKDAHSVRTTIEPHVSTSSPPVHSPLYAYNFLSPEGRAARRGLVRGLAVPLVYNAILLWACLSLFFGSLIDSNAISSIKVVAVNLDDGFVGEGIVQGLKKSVEVRTRPHFDWEFADNGLEDDGLGRGLVLEEKSWAVLEVPANASSSFERALSQGDTSSDSIPAVALYFASARYQVMTLAVTVPAIMELINPILSQTAANTTASFLSSANDTALKTALQCQQCLSNPLVVQSVDLIPFEPPVAFGVLNTGLIFLLTFTFNIFTILRAGAQSHGHLFALPTQFTLRITLSLSSYLFLSLMYSLVALAFSVPLTGHYPEAVRGFMVLWMLNWCTMGACGLAMEAVDTVIGMEVAPFFLNVWLIANASGSFAGFEVMPSFYRYGYAMPFYHCIQATRTIVFGTKSHLGLNFAVLVGWIAVGLTGMCAATAWRVKKGRREGVHRVP